MTNLRDRIGGPARRVGADDIADLDEQFNDCDIDGDQRIAFGEFTQLLDNLGSELGPEHRRTRFDALDRNRDGYVDRGEFMEWWRRERP